MTSIIDILQGCIPTNNKVTIQGWVRTRRDSKIGISFLNIYDGSCIDVLQVIINNNISNYYTDVMRLTTGCSVSVTGLIVESPGANQHYEMQAHSITVFGWVKDPNTYPVAAKQHSLEYLRNIAHLRPRTNLFGAVARVRHTLAQAIHRFMDKQRFVWVSTPLITTFNAEGAGRMFRVSTLDLENLPRKVNGNIDYNKDFFGKEAFLTVSGQLSGESYACALSKIYTFGPTFRAENSNTSHHLAEFWMVEPEVAFATLEDIVLLAKRMLKYVTQVVLNECDKDMHFFDALVNKTLISRLKQLIYTDFIQIDYTEAISILQNYSQHFDNSIFWGSSLSSEHEKFLTEKYFNSIVILTNYPKNIKAFYMRINDDNKTVAAMDILVPDIGEIIGGSQREERLDKLDIRLKEMGLSKDNYWWYRDLRRYGTVPHAGFGLGFDRLLCYLTGIKNIRDAIPFPRSPCSADF